MKQEIPKEDGRLKYLCNEAHFFVADKVERIPPNRITNNPRPGSI